MLTSVGVVYFILLTCFLSVFSIFVVVVVILYITIATSKIVVLIR